MKTVFKTTVLIFTIMILTKCSSPVSTITMVKAYPFSYTTAFKETTFLYTRIEPVNNYSIESITNNDSSSAIVNIVVTVTAQGEKER